MKLYDYQQEAVEFAKLHKYTINAFVMGLGKTLVALALHKDLDTGEGFKTLIVCPKYLIQNWKDEIDRFLVHGEFEFCNYAMLTKLTQTKFDLIIVDEAHYLKNPTSLRSTAFKKLLLKSKPSHLLMLTGTPCKNDVSELFNLLNLCQIANPSKGFKKYVDNYFKFKRAFMQMTAIKMRGRVIQKFYGFRNKTEYKKLYEHCLIRRKVGSVKLPPAIHKQLAVGDFSFDVELKKLAVDFDKQAYMTLKAAMALKLVDFTYDIVRHMSEQVVIFTDHQKSAYKLAEMLCQPAITGLTNSDERDKIISDFKSGKVRHLIATYKTAGTGLNLTNSRYMVFNDLPFVPADIEQARARILRIGQSSTCFYYYVGLSDMYFKLYRTLKTKSEVLKELFR